MKITYTINRSELKKSKGREYSYSKVPTEYSPIEDDLLAKVLLQLLYKQSYHTDTAHLERR